MDAVEQERIRSARIVIEATKELPKEQRVAILTALSGDGKCFVSCADVMGACPMRTDGKDCDGMGTEDFERMLTRMDAPEFKRESEEMARELFADIMADQVNDEQPIKP